MRLSFLFRLIGAILEENVANIVLSGDIGIIVNTWQAQNQIGWLWIGKSNKT